MYKIYRFMQTKEMDAPEWVLASTHSQLVDAERQMELFDGMDSQPPRMEIG